MQLQYAQATRAAARMPMPSIRDRESFWRYADAAKEATEALAAVKMQALVQLPIESLREVCLQYRFFTIDYIADLALLVARLPFGGLRSLLSQILAEELGEGDKARAHPEVYDRFLASIGVAPERLDHCLPANREILGGLSDALSANAPAFGVGLRGMGGECLCQTYLSVMYEHMRANPRIRTRADDIDWEFWTIHTGEEDIIHGELTRQAIDDYIRDDPGVLPELAKGYECSITSWNAFWENIFDAHVPRARALA